MATNVIGTSRIPDYVPLAFWPDLLQAPQQAPVVLAPLSDVDASLMRIDFELDEVGRLLSRFAPQVHDPENAAVFLEPADGSIYDDVDTWEMSVVSMTDVDHEHILEYSEDDHGLWR
jgi:hypothetical protein